MKRRTADGKKNSFFVTSCEKSGQAVDRGGGIEKGEREVRNLHTGKQIAERGGTAEVDGIDDLKTLAVVAFCM